MRSWLVVLAFTTGVDAEPARWQQATSAPSIVRVWGVEGELYGVGPDGVHRSTDGVTWTQVDAGAANGIWGEAVDDLWVVRDRSIHHFDGQRWTKQSVSFGTKLEGVWGIGRDRYVFGVERSSQSGVVLHSRDGGTWQRESIALPRVSSVWGRSASEVFAVGGRDVMRSSGDGTWVSIRTGTETLHAIGGTAKTIYAVGDNGTILAFDGKAWSRRASGVTYALSSITSDLYIGSNDGPPLRSTDGITWRPITALVPKGHVWASGTSMIAVAGEVHVLGGPPSPTVVPMNPLGLPSRPSLLLINLAQEGALRLRFNLDNDDKLPHRRDLLRIVTSRFGDGYQVLPRLARPGRPPTLRFDEVKDCAGYTPPPWTPTALIPARLTCTSTCGAIKISAKISQGPVSEVSQTAGATTIASCSDQQLGTQLVVERIERDLANRYLAKLYDAITHTTPGTDERVEALSHYLLEGGDSPMARRALAAEFGVPEDWRGLFWNPAITPAPTKAVCVFEHLFAEDAAASKQHERYGDALTGYEALFDCGSIYVEKAAFAACRAHAKIKARWHYSSLSADKQPEVLAVCRENGLDPR